MGTEYKLKPCPFCGSAPQPQPLIDTFTHTTYVVCSCGVRGPAAANPALFNQRFPYQDSARALWYAMQDKIKKEAADLWNKRTKAKTT